MFIASFADSFFWFLIVGNVYQLISASALKIHYFQYDLVFIRGNVAVNSFAMTNCHDAFPYRFQNVFITSTVAILCANRIILHVLDRTDICDDNILDGHSKNSTAHMMVEE